MERASIVHKPTQTVKPQAYGCPRVPRPVALSLDTPIQYLKGVGPRRSVFFRKLGLETLRDLVYHFPRRHEDRRGFRTIAQLVPGEKGVVRGRVSGSQLFRARTGTLILQVVVQDESGTLVAIWFNQPYMRRWFPPGEEIILYGTAERVGRRMQMVVPEFELIPNVPSPRRGEGQGEGKPHRSLHMGRVVPIYPATSGLKQREMRTAVARALKAVLPTLEDPLPVAVRKRRGLLDFPKAIVRIHFPPAPEAVEQAKARLSFDELLAFQLALALRRKNLEAQPGISHAVGGDLVARWGKALPFQLTPGQTQAMQAIAQDMAAPRPMRRLLQGEVGSGKTVVAAYAMVIALQNGFQSVLMAPTEVLARQQALGLSQLLAPIDVPVSVLTSALDEKARRRLAEGLSRGAVPILVGTHALLEPWVQFPKLGLVVIDEQQKFGVDQRDRIASKGDHPDLLILTATPIPRTLALTLYGEMEISAIAEKPAGRQPVRTLWMDATRRQEAYAFVRKELEAGRQAYVVCPRIGSEGAPVRRSLGEGGVGEGRLSAEALAKAEWAREDLFPSLLLESDTGDKRRASRWVSAAEMFEEYRQVFSGFAVALLHGRMSSNDQREVFAAFKRGQIQVLVATQVIEVGVDVANATVMVVEGADKFGLPQLHQLRGRVGRGRHESTCILLADPKTPAGVERMETMIQVQDAFRIAEEDLRLRGPGEVLGKKQSGLPDLKCLEWATHGPWLEVARLEADQLLTEDPDLKDPALLRMKKDMYARFPQLTGPWA